jgi:diadenosine tetraphosphate (Ap4A) HIT family hydrolase
MILETCKLCRPSKGVILRAQYWTVVLNENQTLLGRCYFALNRHETDALATTMEEQAELFDLMRDVKTALDALFSPNHYNYVMLMNTEPHVHSHIVPRYSSERVFSGEVFVDGQLGDHYDPSAVKVLADDIFQELTDAISGAMPRREGAPTT